LTVWKDFSINFPRSLAALLCKYVPHSRTVRPANPVGKRNVIMRTIWYTALALVAFAANSVLCRLALGSGHIDAAAFTFIRLASGTATLLAVTAASEGKLRFNTGGDWASGAMLFLYAAAFSFAYLSLSAATGALILFGAVQVTMIVSALRAGERPHVFAWAGLALALSGLVYLVLPGLTAPSPTGSALMAAAGVAWGIYTLRGRGTRQPLAATTGNFTRTLPMVLVLMAICARDSRLTIQGALLAGGSGALASGCGYVIWYAALRGLSATLAATLQLSVPVLSALGGIVFIEESVTWRLCLAAAMILGGVSLAIAGHHRMRPAKIAPSHFQGTRDASGGFDQCKPPRSR
jgi:drug/metabolite transporter (DMT)-like permease